ncbi:hypothetical protein DAPPUDRAFT_346842 [Daphnia pulex]|uniref:Gustatory receptor n=1 Tax=Daphnia pulex TaxID=6669 RepID=E9H9M5_DAPPU|nr:hypothetical protein DAPPUDRAFT_346842 [Daphnia pulex]|eukprot:EFX71502.1 hypothetical protein DAPPUDRAFT_346842 [Daphnia pulex]
MSFQWSLQPMIKWMHFIGVYLESPGKDNSSRFRLFVTAYGFILFFVNVYSNGMMAAKFLQGFENISHQTTSSVLWNAVVSQTNYILMTIGCQLSLISGAVSTWPGLIHILREMEKERYFVSKDFHHFRRIYLSGLGFLIAVILAILGIAVTIIMSTQNQTKVDTLFQICFTFLLIFVFSGGALFSCFGWMVASMLTILAERVVEQSNSNCSGCDWEKTFVRWRHLYLKISRLVDKMNECYGFLLLFLITSSFVVTINSSFIIMRDVNDEGIDYNCFIHSFFLIIQFSHFAVLAYVPHRIRESAIYLSKQLRELKIGNEARQNKVNFFILDVLNSLPQITALGLFDVNLRLAPTIVGTTLTYLVILCQLHYSAK